MTWHDGFHTDEPGPMPVIGGVFEDTIRHGESTVTHIDFDDMVTLRHGDGTTAKMSLDCFQANYIPARGHAVIHVDFTAGRQAQAL